MATFYQKYEKELGKLLKNYAKVLAEYQPGLFDNANLIELYSHIENKAMKHSLREYQKNALYILDCFNNYFKRDIFKELIEEIEIEDQGKNKKVEIPFATFEMATGSGKTLLMGAMMYFFNKMYNFKNFLVITPPAKMEIYYKTIKNFSKRTKETIWADNVLCDFNIITGDNYNQQTLFDSEKDFNIFIFNIDKFREGATKTKNPNENSLWRDDNGNTISLQDYLRNKKLIIFTDEAHHNQNKSGALQIIKNFTPKFVLEFTATAREIEKEKKEQKVVYKYNIKDLLEDKYCKIVKAFGILSELKKKSKEVLPVNEKVKLFAILLIHLAKKYCLKYDFATKNLKPLCFIKINRSITEGTEIYNYLRNKLLEDKEIIKLTITEINKEISEITKVINIVIKEEYKNNLDKVLSDMKRIITNSIYYHSDSPKEVENIYSTIQESRNPCELVVYHKILDEGIDLPNIYTIGVINDVNTNLLIPVKQIIGRGVRLNKPLREFDDEVDIFKTQTEKIHIVCDKDKNFEKVIIDIQNEFGVTDKYIGIDKEVQPELNLCNNKLLSGRYFPRIKASLKRKHGADIFNLMEDYKTVTDDYIKYNSFKDDIGDVFIKYKPESLFTEIDLFSDEKIFHEQILKNDGKKTKFVIGDKNKEDITKRIIKDLHCIPNIKQSKEAFCKYFEVFDSLPLYFYSCDSDDLPICQQRFINTFCFFYKNYIEGKYFTLIYDYSDKEGFPLQEYFKEHKINHISDEKNVMDYIKDNDEKKLIEVISNGYFFSHFKNSFYKYVKFDSLPEYKTASIFDKVIEKEGNKEKNYWIKNDRRVYLEYGSHKYFPDFILFLNDNFYVIETKGEKFSVKLKNLLLNKINDIEKYKAVLLYEKAIDEIIKKEIYSIEKIIDIARTYEIEQLKEEKVKEKELILKKALRFIEDFRERMFKDLLPVYLLEAACGKFGEDKEMECLGWVEVKNMKLDENLFITQVHGKSMEPKISDGSFCIFRANPVGSRNNKILLVRHSEISDPETGGAYTIKKYYSEKIFNKNGTWRHIKIELKPLNNNYEPFIFENVQEDFEGEFKIIAEFVDLYLPVNHKK